MNADLIAKAMLGQIDFEGLAHYTSDGMLQLPFDSIEMVFDKMIADSVGVTAVKLKWKGEVIGTVKLTPSNMVLYAGSCLNIDLDGAIGRMPVRLTCD